MSLGLRNVCVFAVALALALTGVAVGAQTPDEAAEQTFYLRRTGCQDNARMSVVAGSGEGGCGWTLTGTSEVYWTIANDPYVIRFPAADGLPVFLDPSRTVTGTIIVADFVPTAGDHSPASPQGQSVGRAWVDVRLWARAIAEGGSGGFTGTIASVRTEEYMRMPAQGPRTIAFEFPIDEFLRGRTITELVLSVTVNGTHVGHGAVMAGGESWLTLPTLPKKPKV